MDLDRERERLFSFLDLVSKMKLLGILERTMGNGIVKWVYFEKKRPLRFRKTFYKVNTGLIVFTIR